MAEHRSLFVRCAMKQMFPVTAEATVVCAVDSGAVTEEVAGVVTASVAGVVDGVSFDASVTEVASAFCVS